MWNRVLTYVFAYLPCLARRDPNLLDPNRDMPQQINRVQNTLPFNSYEKKKKTFCSQLFKL